VSGLACGLRRAIGTVIVDHKDVHRLDKVLLQQGPDRGTDNIRFVAGRDYYRDLADNHA